MVSFYLVSFYLFMIFFFWEFEVFLSGYIFNYFIFIFGIGFGVGINRNIWLNVFNFFLLINILVSLEYDG